ncbi:MAG: hypothetical protein Kilf2KO_37270 [Rhodospirillales bacterium]
MFTTARPYRFHVELTDKCNAACPMCQRVRHLDFCKTDYAKVQKIELNLADFEEHFDDAFCAQVAEVEFGGGLGDALAASDCLEICDHLTKRGVRVLISTNGSLRSTDWWRELGHVMRRNDSFVELHVDGLADTNRLYRVNTYFDKIMENAEAYLATGAVAEWHYILFKHNEHQASEARDLSRAMGFRKFVLIDTIRFGKKANFEYQMPSGETRYLEPPSYTAAQFAERHADQVPPAPPAPPPAPDPDGLRGQAEAGVAGIHCKSQIKNSAYINTEGFVSPCCWLSGSNEELVMIDRAGGDRAAYNIRNRSLAEILLDEPFASLYRQDWLDGGNAVCNRKCGAMIRNTRQAV